MIQFRKKVNIKVANNQLVFPFYYEIFLFSVILPNIRNLYYNN